MKRGQKIKMEPVCAGNRLGDESDSSKRIGSGWGAVVLGSARAADRLPRQPSPYTLLCSRMLPARGKRLEAAGRRSAHWSRTLVREGPGRTEVLARCAGSEPNGRCGREPRGWVRVRRGRGWGAGDADDEDAR